MKTEMPDYKRANTRPQTSKHIIVNVQKADGNNLIAKEQKHDGKVEKTRLQRIKNRTAKVNLLCYSAAKKQTLDGKGTKPDSKEEKPDGKEAKIGWQRSKNRMAKTKIMMAKQQK